MTIYYILYKILKKYQYKKYINIQYIVFFIKQHTIYLIETNSRKKDKENEKFFK